MSLSLDEMPSPDATLNSPWGTGANAPRAPRPKRVWGRAACAKAQRGATAVEFALILPVLVILLLGTIEGSLAMYDKAVITNASREGARAGIVARRIPQTDLDIRAVVMGYTDKALINFAKTKIDPVVSVTQETVQGVAALRVSVTYTFHGIGLGNLIAQLGSPWVIQASTVMAYE